MDQQNSINVPLKDAKPVLCEECQHNVFSQSFFLRKVSRFVTGTTEDGIVPIQIFSCAKCGHVNKDFLPPEDNK
jgi:hypothetical protein